jgi:cell division protein FtsN
MAKKLIFQRNLRKAGGPGAPYQKYLVIAAVCLIFLVLLTEHFFKGKTKDLSKTPLPDRGAITKEVPKQPEQSAPERLSELTNPAEVQPAPKPSAPSPATLQRPPTSGAPPEGKAPAPEKAPSAQPAPKDLFPQKAAPSEAPETAALEAPAKPEAKAAGPPPPAKPAPSAEKGDYAVQVEAIFKNRPQAEKVRKDLATKGYSAVVRTDADGGGYLVTTSPSSRSKAYTLQEQMRTQGFSNTKVIEVALEPAPQKEAAPVD